MTGTITDEAYRVKKLAQSGPIGKRQSSFELYALLADCMGLALRCRTSADEFEAMKQLVKQQPTTGNRRYLQSDSDEFQVVCRFIFADLRSAKAEGSNANRYAIILRRAHDEGLTPDTLSNHLANKGGINALFLPRIMTGTITTKCLRLTSAIAAERGKSVTLTLRRRPDGLFDVVGDVICHE